MISLSLPCQSAGGAGLLQGQETLAELRWTPGREISSLHITSWLLPATNEGSHTNVCSSYRVAYVRSASLIWLAIQQNHKPCPYHTQAELATDVVSQTVVCFCVGEGMCSQACVCTYVDALPNALTHARTHARTHTHTHTPIASSMKSLPLRISCALLYIPQKRLPSPHLPRAL